MKWPLWARAINNNVYRARCVCVCFLLLFGLKRSTLMCDEVDWFVFFFCRFAQMREKKKPPLKDVPMQVHGLHKRRNSDQFTLNSEVYRLCKFARPAKQRESICQTKNSFFFCFIFLSSEFLYFRFVSM